MYMIMYVSTYLNVQSLTMQHSALFRNLIKLKGTAKLTAQDERVCLRDSKYILFEILEIRHERTVQAPAS